MLIAAGRRYLLVALGFLALTSIVVSIAYVMRIGPVRLPQQVGRLVILLALGYFVLRGRAWARWVLLACLLGGLWVAFPLFTRPGAFSRASLSATLPLLVMYLGYGVIARGLMYSESVRAFFRAHRRSDRVATRGGDDSTSPAA